MRSRAIRQGQTEIGFAFPIEQITYVSIAFFLRADGPSENVSARRRFAGLGRRVHAPEWLHDEVTADYTDMIYVATPEEIEERRKAFIRQRRLKHRAVPDSFGEAGDKLFAFIRLPPSQWKSGRTTNFIERLHEESKRRIKTQTVLPSADTAAMLFWALLASGQIRTRKINGWQSFAKPVAPPEGGDHPIALAA
jgi:putative transposase